MFSRVPSGGSDSYSERRGEEEDQLQLEEPREKTENETTPTHKRSKISKLADQEETRVHKIEK